MGRNKPISSSEAGRRGGLKRALIHSKKELSAWGKRGGRPRKVKASK